MGIIQTLREAVGLSAPSNLVPFEGAFPASAGILSPWATTELNKFVWSDIFGVEAAPVTRAEAMTVPAVANGRSRILTELAGKPLRQLNKDGLLPNQPSWLYRTDTGVPGWFRMAQTYDDWIFYGHSLWAKRLGTDGQPIDAFRIPYERWTIDADGVILVDDKPAPVNEVKYLPGPMDGLLNIGATTIRAAKDLEATWAGKARNPIPAIVLTEREDNGMTLEEAKKYVDAVAKARRDPNGAVMFVPYTIVASFEGTAEPSFVTEGRNAARLDIASMLALPASAVEATQATASLNYETAETEATDVKERMAFWSEPMEALLSMDDMCPRGHRVRFDFSARPDAPGEDTGPYQED